MESFRSNKYVEHRHHRHEDCGDKRNPKAFPLTIQPHGGRPQHYHSHRLIGPRKITPQRVEVHHHDKGCYHKER